MYSRIGVWKSRLVSCCLWLVLFLCGIALIIPVVSYRGLLAVWHSGNVGSAQAGQSISGSSQFERELQQARGKARIYTGHYEKFWYSHGNSNHSYHSSNSDWNAPLSSNLPPWVLADTKNLRTRQAMLLGAGLEGGWQSPYPVGDNGTSFGPFQLHQGGMLTSLGGTPQQADDPKWSVKAMLPTYNNAVNQISDAKWKSDPESAAEQAAVIAERPAQDYFASRGRHTVDTVWSATQHTLKGKKSTGGMPPVDANLTSAGGGGGSNVVLQGILNAILNSILPGGLVGSGIGSTGIGAAFGSSIKSDLERIGLVVFGGLLILVGLVILAAPAAKSVVSGATSAKRSATTLGLTGNSGSTGPDPADVQRRQDIAERSLALGEQKAQLARQREQRLALRSNVQAPAKGRHAKPTATP